MARSSSSAPLLAGIGVLVALSLVQVWQLDRIEARLVGGVVPPPPVVTGAEATTGCRADAWWANDERATSEPGNLLAMHASCLVDGGKIEAGGTFRRIWGSDPNGMSIYGDGGNSADLRELYRYVSNRLAYRQQPQDPDTWSPELAEYVSISDDRLSITVRLRKGAYWQKPQVDLAKQPWLAGEHEVVADDFLFPLELLLDDRPSTKRVGAQRADFDAVTSVEKLDDHSFRLHYREPRYANIANLLENLEPFPRWLYGYDATGKAYPPEVIGERLRDHWYNDRPIGTGPFGFVEWKQSERIVLARNPGYWGETPAFDRVELKIIADKAAWAREFQNQGLDMTHLLPNAYRTDVKPWIDQGKPPFGDARAKLALNPYFSYFYIGWNTRRPLFSDVSVRKALTYAIDRKSLLEHVYYGLGDLIAGPAVPLQKSCWDAELEPLPHDLEAARRLLAAAGWADTDADGVLDKVIDGRKTAFEFRFLVYAGSQEWTTIGNQVVESFKKIGVRVTPEPLEWAIMQARMQERDFDAYSGSWVSLWETDPRGLFHSSTASARDSQNYVSYENPQLDALIDAYATEFDPARRASTCKQITRTVAESYPYTFMFSRTWPVLYWDWLNTPTLLPDTPTRDLRRFSFNRRPGT